MKRLSLRILFLACLVALATAQSESGVTAYWTDYNVTKNGWDMNASHVFCAEVDGTKPLDWRSQYGWTGFCGSVGPQGLEACGLCLKVTNAKTGDQEKVRIVDTCGAGGLVMDLETAFKPLDTDGNGIKNGHLTVDYEFVDCEEEDGGGPSDSDVIAYWTDYNVTKNNWDMNASHVFCAALDGDKPLEWRSKYGWTGFCGSVGPQGESACGLCLRVTNTETNDQEIVRIVDTCGVGGLVMDLESAFKPLDTNGNGIKLGHLTVDYQFVDCGDSLEKNTVLVSSQENAVLVSTQ